MATYKPYTEVASLPANANGDITILEAHLDAAHGTITDVIEYLTQAVWSAGGVVILGTVTNPSDALVRVQDRLGVTADAKTLVAVGDQSVDLAGVATNTKCLVVIQAKAGASTSHNFTDATTGESITHSLLSAWGKLEVIEGDSSNYPPLPADSVPVAEVTKTGAATLTLDTVITVGPTARAGGGASAWGDLTGTLSDQTDLQNALDAKADASSLATVATTGDYADLSNRPSLGTAAAANTGDFATAAQGGAADTALQPGDELTDLASTGATAGHVPKADGSGGIAWAAESGGGGATDFTDLGDVPSSYSGHGGKVVAVTSGEDGLEFVTGDGAGGGLTPEAALWAELGGAYVHGDDANPTRPNVGPRPITWRGSADPDTAALDGDLWDDSEDWDL